MKKNFALLMVFVLLLGTGLPLPAYAEATEAPAEPEIIPLYENVIPYWTKDSVAMESIVSFVAEVTDESSERFVPVEDRLAVFDFDGTLYG